MNSRERLFSEGDGSSTPPAFEHEPTELRQRFWQKVESQARAAIDQRAPRLPERELSTLKDSHGREVATIERLREREVNGDGSQDAWLILDFDDVMNDTTRFQADFQSRISDVSGIPKERLSQLYADAKVEQDGRSVFRFDQYVKSILAEAPNKTDKIQQLVNDFDYAAYINSSVEKAVLAARATSSKAMRVSLLTFGDPAYQRRRIFATKAPELFDEVIFTEGSKRQVIEESLAHDYSQPVERFDDVVAAGRIAVIKDDETVSKQKPFIMTVDDSPDQLTDYSRLLLDVGIAHARFRHPQAKRYGTKRWTKPEIMFEEDSGHEAAVELYRAARIASESVEELKTADFRRLLEIFRTPQRRAQALEDLGLLMDDKNISYRMEGDTLVRESDRYHSENRKKAPEHTTQRLNAAEDQAMDLSSVNFEEFIREKN